MTEDRRAATDRRVIAGGAAAAVLLVWATRWPLRSHFLFSWDSSNYALAMERIDIAAFRPHPPGYLAYVMAARTLDHLFHDANASLVAWNVVAAILATMLVAAFARDVAASRSDGSAAAAAAALVLVTSPLFWFYNEVAEIYTSELLVTVAIAYAAWHAAKGTRGALYVCAIALAAAAVFKLTAAVVMSPLAAYAWSRGRDEERWRALALVAALALAVAIVFLAVEHDFVQILWAHFRGSTQRSRVVGGSSTAMLVKMNRNGRDLLIAAAAALGPVNAIALLVWAVAARRLPANLRRAFMWWWMAPLLAVLVAVHIGKPGYVVPLLPPACVILGNVYAQQRRTAAVTLLALQAAANVAWFTGVRSFSDVEMAATRRYRDKTRLERLASDLQGLTFPTLYTIRENDRATVRFLDLAARSCPTRDPTVIVGTGPMDWRRVMWYLPDSHAVYAEGRRYLFVGTHGEITSIFQDGITLQRRCPIVWLTDEAHAPDLPSPPIAIDRESGVGWTTRPSRVFVTPDNLTVAR